MRTRTPLRVAVHVCAATRSGVIATAFVAARVAAATGAKLETYPAPAADLPTGPFTVAVAQGAAPAQGSFVYITQQGGRAQSWTTFSFEGGVATVAVTPSKNWTTCVLRPLSLGLTPRRRGGKGHRRARRWALEVLRAERGFRRHQSGQLAVLSDACIHDCVVVCLQSVCVARIAALR